MCATALPLKVSHRALAMPIKFLPTLIEHEQELTRRAPPRPA